MTERRTLRCSVLAGGFGLGVGLGFGLGFGLLPALGQAAPPAGPGPPPARAPEDTAAPPASAPAVTQGAPAAAPVRAPEDAAAPPDSAPAMTQGAPAAAPARAPEDTAAPPASALAVTQGMTQGAPPPPGGTPLGASPRMFVRQVRIVGNTVLPESVLADIAAPFTGRSLDSSALEELRYRLSQAYVSRGYINSGAVLPDQTPTDGVVTYRIIEGRLTGIDVTGTDWLAPGYVRNRLRRGIGEPLNLGVVERSVQLLLQDPNIAQLNAELVPDLAPGEARLRTNVTESRRYGLVASIANDEPPNVGSVLGELNGVIRDLSGWGDALALRYGRTAGVNEGGVSWSVPLTAADTMLTARWDYNGAGVVSDAFRGLDINSTTVTYGLALSQPLYRTPEQSLSVSWALDSESNETSLLGEPFSFSPGYVDGRARATVMRLAADWSDRTPEHALALRFALSRGLPIFGATRSSQQPNADFTAGLGQAQYVHAIGTSQVVARGALQLSGAPLFPFEQIALGGPSTVRGYPVNTVLSDNGALFSLEVRVPVLQPTLPYLATDSVVRLAPFFDYGSGWNSHRPAPSPAVLSSVGIGVLWDIGETTSLQLYYGYGLRRIPGLGHNLEEQGVYFRLTQTVF